MTNPQRLVALEAANAVRRRGAKLKRQIREGGSRDGARIAAREVLAGESSLRFLELMLAVPRVGDSTARRLLGRARVNPAARVNSDAVDYRRRQELAGELLERANGSAP